jgi:hypothetical protein
MVFPGGAPQKRFGGAAPGHALRLLRLFFHKEQARCPFVESRHGWCSSTFVTDIETIDQAERS